MRMLNSTSEMETKRLKVLLCCHACAPNSGSEPGMGWNFASNIARFHDVHVIVEERKYKPILLQFSHEHPEAVKHITFHFIPRIRNKTLRKIWPPSYYWFYRKWQKKAYKLAITLHEKEHFDIVHQITIAGFREPGYLWRLPIPFIWGPIGGFTQTPWRLIPGCGFHGMLYFTFRNILNHIQKRFGYAGRQVAPIAHTILVSDQQGAHDVKKYWKRDSQILLEVSTNSSCFSEKVSPRSENEKFQICWTGHLIPLKALELLLYAIAKCETTNVTLEVIGDGSMAEKWKKLSHSLNIEDRVNFRGRIERTEVLKVMKRSHVFCHTSIKEGGTGTVILEALQSGLPTIILDHGGAAHVIDETCGIKISIKNREQISGDIAKHIDELANNEAYRLKLAEGALARSRKFTWDSKIKSINDIYARALRDTLRFKN